MLASTIGIVVLALEQNLSGNTGGNDTVLYAAEAGCKSKADPRLGIGLEGHFLGRYMIGMILLQEWVTRRTIERENRTYSSCLRSPFRCTSTLTQYSTSDVNEGDHET